MVARGPSGDRSCIRWAGRRVKGLLKDCRGEGAEGGGADEWRRWRRRRQRVASCTVRGHRAPPTHVDAQGVFHKLLKPAEQLGELLGSPGAAPLVQAQHKRLQLLQEVILLQGVQTTRGEGSGRPPLPKEPRSSTRLAAPNQHCHAP